MSRGKIIAIKGQTYQSKQEDNTITCEDNCLFIDRHDGKASDYFRLWTMQNAKEGDVLALSYASKNYVLIYKGLYEKSFKTIMSVFCFYCVEEDTYYDETDFFHTMNRGEIVTPAIKEQRDTLMKAMADAGYIFDFEKKELKKIEPKPWSEEDEEALGDALWCCKQAASLAKDENDMGNIWYAEKWLESIKGRVQPPTNV